mgnify:FL=1|jgi:hypothetical protein
MNFIKIQPQSIELIWPLVKDLVQKPVNQNLGEFNLEDVYNWLTNGYMHLWIIGNEEEILVAVVTEFVAYPRETRLRIVLAGGKKNNMDKWFDIFWDKDSEIHKFAKKNNVKRFEVCGRDGWLRVLARVGFKKFCTVLTREVEI